MERKKVLKTWIAMDDEIHTIDTIEHEGRLWLVPNWLESTTEGWSTPERLVALDQFQHQHTPGAKFQIVVNRPVPKHIFFCKDPAREAPEYEIRLSPALNAPGGKPQ